MTLAEIATVTGKGGLYKVVAPTKSGVILESMDEAKTKMVATTNHRLSLLNEISIYTTTKEGTVQLEDVLRKIHKEYGDDPGVDGNSDSAELRSFLKSILPEFDEDRVYTSDIKKLVKWYSVILKHAPEVILQDKKEQEASAPADETPQAEQKSDDKPAKEEKPKKASSKKSDK
jgi:hypothetical protein